MSLSFRHDKSSCQRHCTWRLAKGDGLERPKGFSQRDTKRVAFNESVLEEKGKVPTGNMAIASLTRMKWKAKVTNCYD